MDWNQIQTWILPAPKQTAWLGIGLIINGTVTEVLRRRNATCNVLSLLSLIPGLFTTVNGITNRH